MYCTYIEEPGLHCCAGRVLRLRAEVRADECVICSYFSILKRIYKKRVFAKTSPYDWNKHLVIQNPASVHTICSSNRLK